MTEWSRYYLQQKKTASPIEGIEQKHRDSMEYWVPCGWNYHCFPFAATATYFIDGENSDWPSSDWWYITEICKIFFSFPMFFEKLISNYFGKKKIRVFVVERGRGEEWEFCVPQSEGFGTLSQTTWVLSLSQGHFSFLLSFLPFLFFIFYLFIFILHFLIHLPIRYLSWDLLSGSRANNNLF